MTNPIDPLLKRLVDRKIIVAPAEGEADSKLRAQSKATTIALNGPGVLNAAVAGIGAGATINGGIADFVRGEIQRGRNE